VVIYSTTILRWTAEKAGAPRAAKIEKSVKIHDGDGGAIGECEPAFDRPGLLLDKAGRRRLLP
jgi:hypothetical protein